MGSKNSAFSYDPYENFLTQNSNGFVGQNSMNYYNGGIFPNTFPQMATFNRIMTNTMNFSNNNMNNNMCSQLSSLQDKQGKHVSINENEDSLDITGI